MAVNGEDQGVVERVAGSANAAGPIGATTLVRKPQRRGANPNSGAQYHDSSLVFPALRASASSAMAGDVAV